MSTKRKQEAPARKADPRVGGARSRRLVRRPEVAKAVFGGSLRRLDNAIKTGKFPAPAVTVGSAVEAWPESILKTHGKARNPNRYANPAQ